MAAYMQCVCIKTSITRPTSYGSFPLRVIYLPLWFAVGKHCRYWVWGQIGEQLCTCCFSLFPSCYFSRWANRILPAVSTQYTKSHRSSPWWMLHHLMQLLLHYKFNPRQTNTDQKDPFVLPDASVPCYAGTSMLGSTRFCHHRPKIMKNYKLRILMWQGDRTSSVCVCKN